MRHTLRKSEILRGKQALSLVFDEGRRIDTSTVRCFFRELPSPASAPAPRCVVGFTVAKKVKRAVDRARIKRLLRESYRRNKELLLPALERSNRSCAVVFLFGKNVSHARQLPGYRQVEQDVRTVLKRIAGA